MADIPVFPELYLAGLPDQQWPHSLAHPPPPAPPPLISPASTGAYTAQHAPAAPPSAFVIPTAPSVPHASAPALEPTPSTSSHPQPPPPQPPKDTTAKMRSCAVCRLRRVACRREPGETDCVKCKERGLVCTVAPVKEKGKFRDGKRVKVAKEIYGPGAGETSLVGIASEASSDHPFLASNPSSLTANARLGTIELKSAVMGNFLESFFKFASVTSFDGDINFRHIFDQAGQRIEQLSDANQVLCGVLLSLGARCSDHPALVGSDAPRITDLSTVTLQDVDLRPFGRQRRQAVEALTKQALQLADEKGAMRMANRESVAALMFVEGIVELTPEGFRTSSGYATAYKGQIRQLLADFAGSKKDGAAKRRGVNGTILSWTAYVRDALTAAYTGLSPTFSDDDAFLLRGEEEPPPVLPEQITRPYPTPENGYWMLLDSYVHWVSDIARAAPAGLTGARAKKLSYVNEPFAREYLEKVAIAIDAAQELTRRAGLVGGQANAFDALALARTMRLSANNLALLLHAVVTDRLSQKISDSTTSFGPWAKTSSGVNDEYSSRLEALGKDVEKLTFKAARDVVAILADALTSGHPLGTHAWLDSRTIEILFTRMHVWVNALLTAPVAEAGGLPGFTFDAKISDLRWILRSLRSVGWSSEVLASSHDWVAAELVKVERAQDDYQRALPLAPYLSTLSPFSPVLPQPPALGSTRTASSAAAELHPAVLDLDTLLGPLGQFDQLDPLTANTDARTSTSPFYATSTPLSLESLLGADFPNSAFTLPDPSGSFTIPEPSPSDTPFATTARNSLPDDSDAVSALLDSLVADITPPNNLAFPSFLPAYSASHSYSSPSDESTSASGSSPTGGGASRASSAFAGNEGQAAASTTTAGDFARTSRLYAPTFFST
ncbi:hypothetical protein JCM8097_005319 [Rhodosporidiobolus ruineniae]